ncbi:MAG TPA: 2-C-methyl-D-erythritol 4-phosphate cytidylyltransferase [Thermoanaerobaculia bacterium]|nr:2-C-methyl-D-erythritol 4-phosphate cytidylyltransferase [Thermoanaerobaculia bacterium]
MIHALIPAAGSGRRTGLAVPKQLLGVAGRPLLAWAVARLRAGGAARFVVALPPELVDRGAEILGEQADAVHFVAGGATRQESVQRCLAECAAAPDDAVLVHDAARPAVDPRDVAAVVAAASAADGAVLGRDVSDTLKRLVAGQIAATVDRSGLFQAETPQAFRRETLARAHAAAALAGFTGTDEASLVERLPGSRVVAVHARHPNPKLTWPADLPWLAALLRPEGG